MPLFLHVLNGDATREKLERSGVPGDLTVWADVLHDGPAPGRVSRHEWRRVRARHLSGMYEREEDILRQLEVWDAALDRYAEYDEVVFWFEHDLFDQLILIRHLHWLAEEVGIGRDPRRAATVFSLICIGEFPGVEHFTGLGPLRPEQLATLLDRRAPITPAQIETGRRAWELFTGSDPIVLDRWRRGDARALPFLAGALRRHLEDFPWIATGLSRSERQILQAVAEGHQTLVDVFRATQQMEERVFMGDGTFASIARALADARYPLLTMPSRLHGPTLPDGPVELTATGREVLAGGVDHVELNGIDRWMGGVHLTDGRYRWNPDVQEVHARP